MTLLGREFEVKTKRWRLEHSEISSWPSVFLAKLKSSGKYGTVIFNLIVVVAGVELENLRERQRVTNELLRKNSFYTKSKYYKTQSASEIAHHISQI